MLDQSLFELAIATCFSSNSLARNLKVHLLQSPASDLMDKGRFEAACLQVLKDDLDADYARRFRLGDIAHALEVVWPRGVFSTGHLPCLDLHRRKGERKKGQVNIQTERQAVHTPIRNHRCRES